MRQALVTAAVVTVVMLAGCRAPSVTFPAALPAEATPAGAASAYDTDGNGRADFVYYPDANGVVQRIGYDFDGDARADEVIDLSQLHNRHCRHLLIILDGLSYDLVRQYHEAGGLRIMGPPSKVVSPYPSMTDVSMEDLLNYLPCGGYEAKYYDRRGGKLVGGAMAYLRGFNQPYGQLLNYRANILWDVLGYIEPRAVFRRELNDVKRRFDRGDSQEMLAYIVSSAGMGTRFSAAGQLECLREVERLVNQVVWQTRGLTRVTIVGDHGHSYTRSTRLELEDYLKGLGWRVTEDLKGGGRKEAMPIRFGLVNYVSLITDRKRELAVDLAANPAVLVVSYAQDEHVVVLGSDHQEAIIRRQGDRYAYERTSGDPLGLDTILATLSADAQGHYDQQDLLEATADHQYPDPLRRLWRAHFALVHNPPDVVASLHQEYYFGLESLARRVKVASTHGSLQRCTSLTFAMTNAGPLPPVMRSDQVPQAMGKLFSWPWPTRR